MNNFLKQFLRLWLIHYGSFEGIEKSIVASDLEAVFKRQRKISTFEDFLYSSVGYLDDSYLSAKERFEKRKEISQNINNHDYFRTQCLNHSMTRTSEIVDYYNHKDLLGLGRECISMKSSDYSFNGFRRFLKSNEDVVNVFCSGADIMPILGYDLTYSDLKETLGGCTFDYFKSAIKDVVDPSKLIRLIRGSQIKFTPVGLEIPNELYDSHDPNFICTCLVYAYLIDADKIDITLKNYTELYISRIFNFFKCSDDEFTYCMDLSHMYGCNVIDLLNKLGLNLPTPEKMMSISNGLFTLHRSVNNDEYSDYLVYLPATCKAKEGLPVFILSDKFSDFLKSGLDNKIVYKGDEPFIGSDCLVNYNLIQEVFS